MISDKQRIQQLEDRILELEDAFGISDGMSMGYLLLGIEPAQRKMLGCMMAMEKVSRDQMYVALWGHLPEHVQPEPKNMDTHMCRMRARLRPWGIEVTTHRLYGWSLSPAMKTKVREQLAELSEQYRKGEIVVRPPKLRAQTNPQP